MEFIETGIVVFIVFLAAFYLLKVSISKKDNNGCGCSNDCVGCSQGNCSTEIKNISEFKDNK
jgi:hypothetical protein